MHFENFVSKILFKINAKLSIKKTKKKKQTFSEILGRSEKGKQVFFFFLGLTFNSQTSRCYSITLPILYMLAKISKKK